MSRIILVSTADYVWEDSSSGIILHIWGGLHDAVVYTIAYCGSTIMCGSALPIL